MDVRLLGALDAMTQTVSISERIFRRWCEKLRNEQIVPPNIIEAIELLYEQGRLSDTKALNDLMSQMGETEDDQH